jgi:hypothetical protein
MSVSQELRELVETLGLKKDDVIVDGEPGGPNLNHQFDVSPEQFLLQATSDFETGGNSRRLNSLTNSKRAIEAQVDKVIFSVGYDPRRMAVKRKWELLREIGFVTPRILMRVNNSRNKLEHRYLSPSDTEVEDALDLATLFVEGGNRGIGSFSLGNRNDYRDGNPEFHFKNELSVEFRDKEFMIWAFKNTPDAPFGLMTNRREYNVGEILIGPVEPIYKDLVRLAVAVDREIPEKIEPAVHKFFDSLRLL